MMDYHIHTRFSDGEEDYKTVIDLAVEKGLDEIAITDHFDRNDQSLSNRFATDEQLEQHFESIKSYSKSKPIRVLCGVETCTGFDGGLTLSQRVQSMCDIIITSPHYIEFDSPIEPGDYFNKDYWLKYRETLLHMAEGQGDVLGHPEGYLPIKPMGTKGTTYESRQKLCREICDRYFDREFVDKLGDALIKSGKSYELHGATSTPREWVIERLAGRGVTFSIGSDAHAVNILGKTQWAYQMVHKYSLRLCRLPR